MALAKKNSFEELVNNLSHVHGVLQNNAAKAVDRFLSLRNWTFGYYIVEYEQKGEDRAKYGENLMMEIAGRLTHIKGLRFRQLYVCKDFYLTYPYFLRSLTAKSSNEKVEIITKNENEENNDLQLQPELLLSHLTFTHFVELIRVDDSLQRLFYEVETIKNNWTVRELKRAINTSLAFRTAMFTGKEAVIAKIKNLKQAINENVIRNSTRFIIKKKINILSTKKYAYLRTTKIPHSSRRNYYRSIQNTVG
jgi:hypothetical protein